MSHNVIILCSPDSVNAGREQREVDGSAVWCVWPTPVQHADAGASEGQSSNTDTAVCDGNGALASMASFGEPCPVVRSQARVVGLWEDAPNEP